MSRRPTDDDLRAFLDGALDDDRALAIAATLDAQPLLDRRARQLDPLDALLHDWPDPPCPPDLADAALAAFDAEAPTATAAPWALGAALLAAAVALALLGTDPVGLTLDLATALSSLPTWIAPAWGLGVPIVGLALAAVVFVAGTGLALGLSRRTA
jgi:anti-sigma factor RsiW